MASSNVCVLWNPNSLPPVALVKSSTGLSLKIALASLKSSTINGINSARPAFPAPVACCTVVGVAGTLEGSEALIAGGKLLGRGTGGGAVNVVTKRDMSTE